MDFEPSHYRDQVDWLSPPVDPLQFPVPCIYACRHSKVLARDHKSGKIHLVQALVKRQNGDNSSRIDRAYLLKKIMSRSADGHEKTWAAVVLAPIPDQKQSPFDIRWASSTEIVTIRVSSWKNLSHSNKQRLVQEASVLQYVGSSNSNVQGCLEVLKDDNKLYTILPYCLEGALVDIIKPADKRTSPSEAYQPNEDASRNTFSEICEGLLHLQQKGLYHGNICLKSIYVTDNATVVIGDVGMSTRVPFSDPFNAGCMIPQGTVRRLIRNRGSRSDTKYQAPEVAASGFDAFASDIWSAGIVLFALLTGITPFKRAKTSDVVFKAVSSGHLRELLESWEIELSLEVCDLLQSMLRRRPTDRITLPAILNHPWLLHKRMPPKDEPLSLDMQCHLPASHRDQRMELLRQEIVKQRRTVKPTLNRAMHQSLRQELILRTNASAKRVSFGRVEIFSSAGVYGVIASRELVDIDQYEQARDGDFCLRRLQPLTKTEARTDGTNVVARAPAPANSEQKFPVQKHVSQWKRLVRSAKRKLRTVVAKKMPMDTEEHVQLWARSA